MDEIPEDVRDELESYPNVVGTCIGRKRVRGVERDEEAVVVLVARKVPEAQLVDTDRLPRTVTVDGREVRVDVQEVGDVRTQATVGPRPLEEANQDRKRRWRPAPAGVSFGHPEVTAGTLGTPALRTADGETVVLTNAHVAAPIGAASEGDPIRQPGTADGGTAEDQLGVLSEWAQPKRDEPNESDSALVAVEPQRLRGDVLGVGELVGWAAVDRDATYTKSGRTTGVTTGRLRGRNARIKVGGYYDEPVRFVGVDVFGPMSAGGDSGSVIGVERKDGFYGTHLLFAGSDRTTLGIPIETVQEKHGELTVVRPDGEGDAGEPEPFADRIERSLRSVYGTVSSGDSADFVVDAWPVKMRVFVATSDEEALAAVGPALAAAGDDELPVVVYPSAEETPTLEEVRGRVLLVGVDG